MWNEQYAADEYIFGTEPNDFLKANANQLKPGSVLCLADGEGRNGVYLAKLGFEVTALDQSTVGLEKARRLAAAQGVEIHTLCADLNDYVIEPNAWDNIVSIFCHLPSALRKKVHAGAAQGLSPRGVFLLEAYTPRQLSMPGKGGPMDRDLLFSTKMLQRDFAALDVVQAAEIDRAVDEGSKHYGDSAVVQFIARAR